MEYKYFHQKNKFYQLIYETKENEFALSDVQKRNFIIISNNTFIFNLEKLNTKYYYYIEI